MTTAASLVRSDTGALGRWREQMAAAFQASAIPRARSRLPAFRLHRPDTVDEACSLVAARPDAKYLAGGMDIINALKCGVACSDLVSLDRIAELLRLDVSGQAISLGARATHDTVARSEPLAAALPGLAPALGGLASPRVRLKGTLGGNLVTGDRMYDPPGIFAALDAEVVVLGPTGRRAIPVDSLGVSDALAHGELITAIRIPVKDHVRLDYDRSYRPLAAVPVAIHLRGGLVVRIVAALSYCYGWPVARAVDANLPMTPQSLALQATRIAQRWAAELPPIADDRFASGAYRRRLAAVLCARALARLSAKEAAS